MGEESGFLLYDVMVNKIKGQTIRFLNGLSFLLVIKVFWKFCYIVSGRMGVWVFAFLR